MRADVDQRDPVNVRTVNDGFEEFVVEVEPRLRRVCVAGLGEDRGLEATAEALGYAWKNWDRVAQMAFPVPYLFKVGRSRTRFRRRPLPEVAERVAAIPEMEPKLRDAMKVLSSQQRLAVSLVDAFGWSIAEAAESVGVSKSTMQRHRDRGLAKLRDYLGAEQ